MNNILPFGLAFTLLVVAVVLFARTGERAVDIRLRGLGGVALNASILAMLVSGQIFHHALALDALHEAKAVLDYGALSPNQVQRVGRELDRVELHLPDVWRTFLTLPACVGLGLTLAVVFTGRPLGRLNERLASD